MSIFIIILNMYTKQGSEYQLKYISVNEINRNINENRDEFIRMVESNYHNQLNDIAEKDNA